MYASKLSDGLSNLKAILEVTAPLMAMDNI